MLSQKAARWLSIFIIVTVIFLNTTKIAYAQQNDLSKAQIYASPKVQEELYSSDCKAYYLGEYGITTRSGKWLVEDGTGDPIGLPVCSLDTCSNQLSLDLSLNRNCLISTNSENEAIFGEFVTLNDNKEMKTGACIEVSEDLQAELLQ